MDYDKANMNPKMEMNIQSRKRGRTGHLPGWGGPGVGAAGLDVTCQPEMTCHLLRAEKAVNSRAPPAGGS